MRALLSLEWRLLTRGGMAAVSLLLFAAMAVATVLSVQAWSGQLQAAPSDSAAAVDKTLQKMSQLMADTASGKVKPTDVDNYKPSDGEFVPDLRDPYVTGFYRPQLAVKPPAPWAALAVGAALNQPAYFVITSRPLNEVMAHGRTAELTNPRLAATGVLDLAALTVWVAPLLLIGLLGLGLGRERQGALGLSLAAAGVGIARVLVVRVGLALLLTAAALAVVTLACLWSVGEFGKADGQRSVGLVGGSLWAWAGLAFAYLVFWAGVAACVMAWCRTEVTSALSLVALWVGLVVLLPALAASAMQDPDRTRERVQALLAAQQTDAAAPTLDDPAVLQQALARTLGQGLPTLPPCAAKRTDVLKDYAGRFAYDMPIRQSLAAAQQARAPGALWWSPATLTTQLFERMAGNHRTDFARFQAHAADFHHSYRFEILRRLVACEAIDAAGYARLPTYAAEAPQPAAEARYAAALALAGLLLAGLAAWRCTTQGRRTP
jgi:hypothetical protein